MDIPVYLFTGFLDGGKTSFIQQTLEDKNFNSGENTLLLVCEEGEIEYDTSKFCESGVTITVVEEESDLTEENLKLWANNAKARRVIIEYNGMWQLKSLFSAFPPEWVIYQEMMFVESATFMTYNQNMRSLVVDKLNGAELIVMNRADKTLDRDEIHKIVRGVSRKAEIAYEFRDGHVEYDDIVDPLPFDVEANEISLKETDFALWYRDLLEEPKKYNKKIMEFVGIVAKDAKMPKLEFAIGRHIMTCCIDDVQYGGVVAQWDKAPMLATGEWLKVKGKLKIEYNELYGEKGPVLKIIEAERCDPPKEKIATFY